MAERTASEEDLIAEAEAGDEEAQAECQSRGLSFRLNAAPEGEEEEAAPAGGELFVSASEFSGSILQLSPTEFGTLQQRPFFTVLLPGRPGAPVYRLYRELKPGQMADGTVIPPHSFACIPCSGNSAVLARSCVRSFWAM